MRLIPVALVVALAACGGDDPEPLPRTDPVPARPATDTDTAAEPADEVAETPNDTAATAAASEPESGAAGRRLYTVQVAAFLDPGSADAWVERLRSQGWPVWSSVAQVDGRMFHRVRVGALPTVEEARRLGRAVVERYQWPVWLARVTPADRPPANVVESTRQALGRS